jgi:hypothetical protein
MPPCGRSLVLALVLLISQQVGAARPPEVLRPFEIRSAIGQLGYVRMLGQRISRQHLLTQLRLAEDQKHAMVRTADEMDAVLRMLGEGAPLLAVPAPPTRDTRTALEALEGAWGPLRTMAHAGELDYVRRAGLEGRSRSGDPLLVLYVDDLASDLGERADAAVALYVRICEQNGFADCASDASTAATGMLERLMKQVGFVIAGIDLEQNRAALRKSRDELDRALRASLESPLVLRAMSSEHGASGSLLGSIHRAIEQGWPPLRAEVDGVLEGDEADTDLRQMQEAHAKLLYTFERFMVASIAVTTPFAAGGSSGAERFKYEYDAAQRLLGRLRALMERLNKDNVLYRLRIEDDYKVDAISIDTAAQIDAALLKLREGDPRLAVPRPPTREIEEQLAELERAWPHIRRMAQANPFDYLRRARELVSPGVPEPDPLLLRHSDHRVAELQEAVDRTSRMYSVACERDGYRPCGRGEGLAEMLSEQLLKQAIFVFAGIETGDRLDQTREAFDGFMAAPTARRDLDDAAADPRGREARHVRELIDVTRGVWLALRRELDVMVKGHAEPANLQRAIDLQRRMALDLERLDVAVGRLPLDELRGSSPPDTIP